MKTSATGNLSRFCCVALIAALAAGCGSEPGSPEAAIRAWVARGEAAAEAKDRGELMSMVAPAYADARGNDRGDLDRLIRLIFLRVDPVALVVRIDRIEVFDETAAELDLQVAMAGGRDNLLGFSADAVRYEMELVHDGDDWRLQAARWGGLGDDVR